MRTSRLVWVHSCQNRKRFCKCDI